MGDDRIASGYTSKHNIKNSSVSNSIMRQYYPRYRIITSIRLPLWGESMGSLTVHNMQTFLQSIIIINLRYRLRLLY